MPAKVSDVAQWLVSKTGGFLDKRLSRRSFIARTTMVGTAVAASGCAVVAGPGSPYTYVTDCGGGSLCRDGYTEFCCVINSGQNQCPPGTAAAGWWRASGSAYCPGGTRFFVDCNNWQGAGPCRCAAGCGTRKVYCNHFRYGQCNTHIQGTGVIACRLVTCVPPYDIAELNCNPSGAVDQATANHNADCAAYGQPGAPPPPPPVPVPLAPAVGSVISDGAGNITFVGRAQDGTAQLVQATGGTFGTWQPLGGSIANVSSRIAIAAYGANRLLTVAEDAATGAPIWSDFDGVATWTAWDDLDGLIASDPVLVTQGSSVVMVVRGHDAALHYRTWNGTAWGAWIGGTPETTNSNPAGVDDGGTVLFCSRGTDRAIHFNRLSGGAPTGWTTIDSIITSDPVLVPASPGAHYVARGDDGMLHLHGVGGASPSGWESLPAGGFTSEPAVASFSGELHVLGRGQDNQIYWSRRASGSWSAWQPLSGLTAGGSPIAVHDGAALFVLVLGADSQLWFASRTGSSWGAWTAVPGPLLAPTTAYF